MLWGGPAEFAVPYVEAGRRALAGLGYVEGKNYVVEMRFGERKPGAVVPLAAALAEAKVDVIVAVGDPAIQAARRATSTIPIVMVAAGDPVRSGYAQSLGRPGGNLTGMTFLSRELAAKRLELLKEAVPTVSRVAVLWNPENPGGLVDFGATRAAAEALRLTVESHEVRTPQDFEPAVKAMVEEHAQGIVIVTDPLTAANAGRPITALATKHRLPVVYDLREYVLAGGLVSYGPSLTLMAERSAIFVDRILKGGRPADIPIEQPNKFELVINRKTARALGLAIPSSLLLRADQVIE